jgi:hypothetical protein
MDSKLLQPKIAWEAPPAPKPGTAAEAEQLLAGVDTEAQVVLFHSSSSDHDESIRKNWLEPQIGEWVNEVLSGATDDQETIDQIREESHGVVYLDKVPGWVVSKACRAAGKDHSDITREDVRKWGQLTIVVADKDDSGIRRYLGEENTDSYYPMVESMQGRPEKFYDHDKYFGLEPGDYFSDESVEPAITLVGDELITFLKKHYPQALRRYPNWKGQNDRQAIRDGSYLKNWKEEVA